MTPIPNIPIFLETSLQIHRVLADGKEQKQLEEQIRRLSPTVYSSSYVWMEYQRTLIADYAHIHHLIVTYDSWSKVITHLLAGQRSFRPQTANRCTRILGLLYEQCQGNWEYAQLFMERALTIDLRTQFWTYVRSLSDTIACDLIPFGIQQQTNGEFLVAASCRKTTATCHLPDFLASHRPELHAIADYLLAHPGAIKGQGKVERLLKEVLHDPRAALGQTACWPLGDVIIALQVPPGMQLWTRDPDFKALAAALGITLYTPSAFE